MQSEAAWTLEARLTCQTLIGRESLIKVNTRCGVRRLIVRPTRTNEDVWTDPAGIRGYDYP